MLTREEANRLKHYILCTPFFDRPPQSAISLLEAIDRETAGRTEKPERQVKVGYYYKDGHGNLEMVTEITAIRIITNYGNYYRLDGTEMDSIDERNNLDLSKPYKLVEVKDVE